ncbi:MAG: hypothetical protein R8K46_02180 [Mariprofundaceae bacterium]
MHGWLRWALAACATLIAVMTVFLLRLDTDELRLRVSERMSATLEQPVHIAGVHLSLMHGLSFDLDKINIKPQGERKLALQADKASVQLALIDLLRGDIDITTLFLLSPRITLPVQMLRQWRIPEGLELEQVKIQNGEIWLEGGKRIASSVLLDVRNIMPDSDLRWELSADIRDGNLRTFGQASLRGRSVISAFGKLEVDNVPVASLPLAEFPAWLNQRQTACRLTFNLNRAGNWKLDGDIDINLPDHTQADIHLRGKMSGSVTTGALSWRDSFVHIGGKNVLTIRGEQTADGTLAIKLQGKQLKLDEMLAVADIPFPARGLGEIDTQLRFDGDTWTSDGLLNLRRLQWNDAPLPDLDVQLQGLTWREGQLSLAQTQINHPGKSGLLLIKSAQWSTDGLDLQAQLQAVEDWWMPLSNSILASHGASGTVEGEGLLSGQLNLHSEAQETALEITMDATAAALTYQALKKPRGIAASGKLALRNSDGRKTWQLDEVHLGHSHLAQGNWLEDGQEQRLQLQGMQVDASELGAMGMWETLKVKKWHGRINGELDARRTGDAMRLALDDLPSWLDTAVANVDMASFGLDDSWSGGFSLKQGQARATLLSWRSKSQSVQFSGNLDLPRHQGRLDIKQSSIDLDKLPDISGWLTQARLEGELAAMRLTSKWGVLDNAETTYNFRDGKLKLKNLRASLKGGRLRADNLSLDLADPTWPLSLPRMHLHKIQLNPLESGSEKSSGRLFATIGLSGHLRGGQWRANGDVEIYKGELSGLNLAASIGALTGEPYGSHEDNTVFSKFSTRFRLADNTLRLQHINMVSPAFKLEGAGKIDIATLGPDIHLDATLLPPLQAGLKPLKSYVEHDGSIHAPLLLSGRFPDVTLDLNESKLKQIHAMKNAP